MNKVKLSSYLKRMVDIIISFLGILIVFPVLLIISLFIKLESSGPIIFTQIRIGREAKEFKIYKFRTMVVNAEKLGRQITVGKDSRVTKVGRVLRKTKLDELPQLFNVLKGDMSLVGPRPEVPKYTKLYNEEQKRVFTVRPGITDYASIKYRNENEVLAKSKEPEKTYIEEVMVDKLNLNLKYVEQRSFWLDIKIIFITLYKIIK